MPQLIKTCNAVVGADASIGCTNDAQVGFPYLVVFGKEGVPISGTAEVPTPSEVQAYINAGHGYMFHCTNGKVLEPELQTLSGADTYTNAEEVIDEMNGIEVTIRKISNDMLTMFRQNTLNNSYMRLWWVDNFGRWYGGREGFLVPHYIPEFSHGGYGEQAKITRSFKWRRNLFANTPISAPNNAYKTLVNYVP